MKKSKRFNIILNERDFEILRDIAMGEKTSVSNKIRELIRKYIKERESETVNKL
jgi:metal-responsive CopG/Arc/MetJ family transcriptional regulator